MILQTDTGCQPMSVFIYIIWTLNLRAVDNQFPYGQFLFIISYMKPDFLNTKLFISFLIVLAVGGSVYFFFFGKDKTESRSFIGTVVEIKGNSIVAEGMIKILDEDRLNIRKTMTFKINDEANLIKTVIIFDTNRPESEEAYSPETIKTQGSLSDLGVGMAVNVTSKENLVKTNKATAVEINYVVPEFKF